jgi:L-alanine-DL-glutamate epimerase-like enolase superfamily enzyme
MKIAKVEALPLAIPYHIGEGRGGRIGEGSRLDFCLVRVETDTGLVGWGEAFSYHCRSAVVAAVRDMIAPLAIGEDALEIDFLQRKIQKRLHIFGRMGFRARYKKNCTSSAAWASSATRCRGSTLRSGTSQARRRASRCTSCWGTRAA